MPALHISTASPASGTTVLLCGDGTIKLKSYILKENKLRSDRYHAQGSVFGPENALNATILCLFLCILEDRLSCKTWRMLSSYTVRFITITLHWQIYSDSGYSDSGLSTVSPHTDRYCKPEGIILSVVQIGFMRDKEDTCENYDVVTQHIMSAYKVDFTFSTGAETPKRRLRCL